MPIVEVSQPAAWCFVPLGETQWLVDPTRDKPPRYPNDGGLDWLLIANTVTDAVQLAQSQLTDAVARSATVEIDRLAPAEMYVVQEWLSVDAPEFNPASADIVNGRHRTWHSRVAGAVEAPVINLPVGYAVFSWNDDNGWYWKTDLEALEAWRLDRQWWDLPEADPWSSRNRTHLKLWDEALDRWAARL